VKAALNHHFIQLDEGLMTDYLTCMWHDGPLIQSTPTCTPLTYRLTLFHRSCRWLKVKQWQSRHGCGYPVVCIWNCIQVKARDAGAVRAKAIYTAIGISYSGREKCWVGYCKRRCESAGSAVTELKNRGVQEIFASPVWIGLEASLKPLKLLYQSGGAALPLSLRGVLRNSLPDYVVGISVSLWLLLI
jgi:hypothetical protein